MAMYEEIRFYGHKNVRALHRNTLEVTKDEHISVRGDCIIGVRADKACMDIDDTLKDMLRSSTKLMISIVVGSSEWCIRCRGDPRLILTDERSMVIRRSDYVCSRTLAVRCNEAASDMPRDMVDMLKQGSQGLMIVECID